MGLFDFDPSKETMASVAEKRRRADAIGFNPARGMPQNVGEGISAVAQALMANSLRSRADQGAKALGIYNQNATRGLFGFGGLGSSASASLASQAPQQPSALGTMAGFVPTTPPAIMHPQQPQPQAQPQPAPAPVPAQAPVPAPAPTPAPPVPSATSWTGGDQNPFARVASWFQP